MFLLVWDIVFCFVFIVLLMCWCSCLGPIGLECLIVGLFSFDCPDQEYITYMKTGVSTGACKVARFYCRLASCCNWFSAIDIHKIIAPAFIGKRSEWLQETAGMEESFQEL